MTMKRKKTAPRFRKSTRFNRAHNTAYVPETEQSEQPSTQKDGTNHGQ